MRQPTAISTLMTDLPDKHKVTLRWLVDHVPVTWWIWLAALLVTIVTASFSVGAQDSVRAWITELALGRLSSENANLRELTTSLQKDALRLNQELIDLKAVTGESSEAEARAEELTKVNRVLADQNQRLSARVREFERENVRLTTQRDDLQAAVDSFERTRVELTQAAGKLAALSDQNSHLLSENKELRRYIDELNDHFEREREKHSQSSSSQGNAGDLIATVPNMVSTDVAGFLIATIPKVQGGVSCNEVLQLVKHCVQTDIARVVKQVASYIQRPFGDTCLSKLSRAMVSIDAADAIRVLVSSPPAY